MRATSSARARGRPSADGLDQTVRPGLAPVDAASANALRSIGVLWGYGGQAELREAGADLLVATPFEVVNLL